VECDASLESSQGELQVCFRPHPNWTFEQRVMNSQSPKSPNQDNFRTLPWESRDENLFRCRCRRETHRILYEGRWWLPPVWAVVSFVSLGLPVACPSTKGAIECELTNLLVSLMQVRVSN